MYVWFWSGEVLSASVAVKDGFAPCLLYQSSVVEVVHLVSREKEDAAFTALLLTSP